MSFPVHPRDVKIVLLEGIHESASALLSQFGFSQVSHYSKALEGDELKKVLSDAHFIGIRSRTQLKGDIFNSANSLLGIGCFCIGTNQVDLDKAAELGVPVFNAPHANTRSVAELVIGLTIMLMRGTFEKSSAAHRGEWMKSAEQSNEVRGKTIGIVGYGHIGSQVSILAESMGMRVLYFDSSTKLPLGNASQCKSYDELLAQSDIVTYHVPEIDETKNIVNATSLSKMKNGSVLINASRGSVVDISALRDALLSKKLKGAAVDVFPKEPKTKTDEFQSELRGFENVILTPHVGGSTEEAQEAIGTEVGGKLAQYFLLGNTEGTVNFPQLNLPARKDGQRIMHIHQNRPGILRQINRVIADEEINIQRQYLDTNGEIGYVVFDISATKASELLPKLEEIEGSIKARIF
jgi:D-3-phosphoglycerate dehydrogenase